MSGPNLPATRRLRAGLAALALAAGMALAACGTDEAAGPATPAQHEHDHAHHHEVADNGDAFLDVTASEFAFTAEHATVDPGPTRIRLRNQGRAAHQLQVGRPKRPMTPKQFTELFDTEGDLASVRALTWVGGVGVVGPGDDATATVDLEPGDYLLVCYVPTPDGTSHVMKGMVAALHVAANEPVPEGDAPEPSESVVLREYQIQVPADFRGRGTVAFRNEGEEPHETVLLRLHAGKTLADAAAWDASTGADPPFDYAGGVASIDPGRSATAELDLAPGDYLATCFVPGPDGTPHVDLGMVATFTVP